MHTLLLSLVALRDRSLGEARLDFVVLLDKSTAEAPVTDAAIVHATALDAESLPDLTTLHHGVTRSCVLVDGLNGYSGIVLHPTTASHAVDRAEYKSIAVAGIGSLHSRVSHTIGGFAQDYGEFISLPIAINLSQRSHTDAGAESAEQARVAGRAIAEVVLPFLVLDIRSLRVLLGHSE